MTRLASMIIPLLAALVFAGAAQAGDYYERVGANRYKPADGAAYSSTCCYKKITKRIVITKTVWVKVAPPQHKHHHDDEDVAETPRPVPRPHHGQVVELGEVIHRGDTCRKAVPVRDGETYIIVMVNVRCR